MINYTKILIESLYTPKVNQNFSYLSRSGSTICLSTGSNPLKVSAGTHDN